MPFGIQYANCDNLHPRHNNQFALIKYLSNWKVFYVCIVPTVLYNLISVQVAKNSVFHFMIKTNVYCFPRPPQRQLTADRLAATISRAITDSGMHACAATLGECIHAEDGVG